MKTNCPEQREYYTHEISAYLLVCGEQLVVTMTVDDDSVFVIKSLNIKVNYD